MITGDKYLIIFFVGILLIGGSSYFLTKCIKKADWNLITFVFMIVVGTTLCWEGFRYFI